MCRKSGSGEKRTKKTSEHTRAHQKRSKRYFVDEGPRERERERRALLRGRFLKECRRRALVRPCLCVPSIPVKRRSQSTRANSQSTSITHQSFTLSLSEIYTTADLYPLSAIHLFYFSILLLLTRVLQFLLHPESFVCSSICRMEVWKVGEGKL